MLTDIEMMTISNLDFLHYMTAVSHEMSDEPLLNSHSSYTSDHTYLLSAKVPKRNTKTIKIKIYFPQHATRHPPAEKRIGDHSQN